MSFYRKLKQRNVIKVAIAYGIAAWLLIQITATTFPVLNIPDWAVSLVTALILIGFPLALIFAWAFELTADGIKLEKDLEDSEVLKRLPGRKLDFIIIVVLVVAVAYLAFDKLAVKPAQVVESTTESTAPGEVVSKNTWENSIAVLPFVNMSSDAEQEYFSDGLSEELLNLLAKISNLKVIGRTSSFAFKGKSEDLRAIGETLNVETILEGSVRKSGDHVRITAQLIDASSGAHIWSETYDRTMTDIFVVQDDVAAAIIGALQIHVGRIPKRGRPTDNQRAYELFLKAREAMNALQIPNAQAQFLQAIDLDPQFAEAYELLAYTYWNDEFLNSSEAQRRSNEAAAKAIAINPDLVFAQALYSASVFGPKLRFRKIQALEEAVNQEPDNPELLSSLCFLLMENGYLEEALGVAEHYFELDPLSLIAISYRALILYSVGRTSEAIEALGHLDQANLGPGFNKWAIEGINLAEHQDEATIDYFESWLVKNHYPDPGWFREMVNGSRDLSSGQAFLDRQIPLALATIPEDDPFDWQSGLMSLYLHNGFHDRHFELILATGPSDSVWGLAGGHVMRGNVFWRQGFTAHPDYLKVMKLLGIIDTWEQRGPPDFCAKVESEWVCE